MPTVSVNLDTTQYVQVNTTHDHRPMLLQAHRDEVRVTLSDLKPAKGNTVFHTLGGDDAPLQFSSLDTNVWALAITDRSSLIVSETDPIPVHLVDMHFAPVNELFHRHTGVTTTVAVASAKGDRTLTVTSVIGLLVGDEVQIENGAIESTFPEIMSIVGNDLTFDRPLDFAHPIGSNIGVIVTNMAVDGSVTPVAFKLTADPGQVWHLVSFILGMTHTSAAADDFFGDQLALTNGVILRAYNATADQYITFTVWKSNGGIKLDMYDVPYTDKAGGGLHGVNANGAIKTRTGAVPRLDGDAGDFMELIVQDDLTALATFKFKGQGHYEHT